MTFDEQQLYLGTFKASVNDRWLSLSQPDRRRHMYVIGQTGSGKSTLLNNSILQDVLAGRGLAFIDPHSDSAEMIVDSIPKARIRDVVYLNPSDIDYPIDLNPLRGTPVNLQQSSIERAKTLCALFPCLTAYPSALINAYNAGEYQNEFLGVSLVWHLP